MRDLSAAASDKLVRSPLFPSITADEVHRRRSTAHDSRARARDSRDDCYGWYAGGVAEGAMANLVFVGLTSHPVLPTNLVAHFVEYDVKQVRKCMG